MSKRRVPDTIPDEDEEVKLQPQTKHLITALSQRFTGYDQLMTMSAFRSHLDGCGFPVPVSTLNSWRASLTSDPNHFTPKSISGRPRALTLEDARLMGGFVMHNFNMNRKLTYADVDDFLRAELDLQTSISTITSYVHAGGFSQQVAIVRPLSDARVSHHQKLAAGLEFIEDLKEEGFYDTALHRKACVDAVHTTHRKDKPTTLAPRNPYVSCLFAASFFPVHSTYFVAFHRTLAGCLQWDYAFRSRGYPGIHQLHRQYALG